ncbi:MAG: WG repeat-containing protein [Azoarcus sp.]|jgi:hypothetical protein|nr:WG repeat-containing protein [Azoarcus sp.]
MKRRSPIFMIVLLFTVVILLLIQHRLESMKPNPDMPNCDKIRQCLKAYSAWPTGMQYCPAILAPLTVKTRSMSGKWGYSVNYEGCSTDQIVETRYDIAEKFGNNGLAKVKSGDKWGYINLKGEEVIQLFFDEVGDFHYGLVPVKSNGKWGYFNAQGQVAVPPAFDAVSGTWHDGLSAVEVNGKWGYIDPRGGTVIAPKFDQVTEFTGGLAKVESNGKWGVVDTQGSMVIPLNFDVIFSTTDPDLLLTALGRKYGYFDAKGNEIIPARLAKPVQMRRDGSGAIQVHLNDSTLTIASGDTGNSIVPVNGWFYLAATNEKVRFDENGKALLWRKGEWFYINSRGRLIPVANQG